MARNNSPSPGFEPDCNASGSPPCSSASGSLLKEAVLGFINDEALSRGAAMAFFAVTSLAPIVLIVIAIAGLVFGREAAQNALVEQLRGIMGEQSAQLIQSATASAGNQQSGK